MTTAAHLCRWCGKTEREHAHAPLRLLAVEVGPKCQGVRVGFEALLPVTYAVVELTPSELLGKADPQLDPRRLRPWNDAPDRYDPPSGWASVTAQRGTPTEPPAEAFREALGAWSERDGACQLCGEQTDMLAGAPSRWPLWLPTAPTRPGECVPNHVGCVLSRVLATPTAAAHPIPGSADAAAPRLTAEPALSDAEVLAEVAAAVAFARSHPERVNALAEDVRADEENEAYLAANPSPGWAADITVPGGFGAGVRLVHEAAVEEMAARDAGAHR